VTNDLIGLAEQAVKDTSRLRCAIEGLRERHLTQTELLLGSGEVSVATSSELSAMIDELAHLAEALATLGDMTPRSLAAISSYGERMSSLLCTAVFAQRGIPAVHVDACDVMITDDAYSRAEPQPDAIAEACRAFVIPLVRDGKVPVMGGFIGSAKGTGVTTTLGRGGSDYSASLFGAAVRPRRSNLTDVDGMSRPILASFRTRDSSSRSRSRRRRSSRRLARGASSQHHRPRCSVGHPGLRAQFRSVLREGNQDHVRRAESSGQRDRRKEEHARQGWIAAHAAHRGLPPRVVRDL
jgi:hypothetical protein